MLNLKRNQAKGEELKVTGVLNFLLPEIFTCPNNMEKFYTIYNFRSRQSAVWTLTNQTVSFYLSCSESEVHTNIKCVWSYTKFYLYKTSVKGLQMSLLINLCGFL